MRFLFFKIPYSIFKIDKNSLKNFRDISVNHILKRLNIKFEKFYIDLTIGVEDAMTNALLVGFLSSLISVFLGLKKQKMSTKEYYYKIVPVYNDNILKFDCNFIFSIKLVELIKALLLAKKIKNEPVYSKPTPIKI